MATIPVDAWNKLSEQVSPQRPSVGKRVRVIEGKYSGKEGTVFWHGVDKFNSPYRYATNEQCWLRELVGRSGFRVGIETPEGKIFVSADKVEVIF